MVRVSSLTLSHRDLVMIIYIYIYIYIYNNLLYLLTLYTRPIFKQCLTGMNSNFSFSLIGKSASLPYHLPIDWRIDGSIAFLRALAWWEMQTASRNLNSGCRVYFLRLLPLHNERLKYIYRERKKEIEVERELLYIYIYTRCIQ